PEHITERRSHTEDDQIDFESDVQVLEPMGMDTMVVMNVGGTEITARSNPRAVSEVGSSMNFTIDMNNMHLIDPDSHKVI
ncbi:MAG: TOBE domain-containing protein, partial [Hyphomicrobiaceae bacterium]